MKYNCKNYIRVFYEASEIWGSKEKMTPSSPRLEISSEEKKRMEEFSEKLINAILQSKNKKEAYATLSLWEKALTESFKKTSSQDVDGKIPAHWRELIATIRGFVENSPKLFEKVTWKKNTDQNRTFTWKQEVINALKIWNSQVSHPNQTTTWEASTEWVTPKPLSEKERQESIDKFANELANQVLDNPGDAKEIIEKKKQEISKYTNSPDYTKYVAIIDTVEYAIKTKVFKHETTWLLWFWALFGSVAHGFNKLTGQGHWKYKEERGIFKDFFRNLVQDAWQKWETQKVDELFSKRMTHWLTDNEAKELLTELNPDKILEEYVKLMGDKDTKKENLTTQQSKWKGETDKIIGKMSNPDAKEKYTKKYAETYSNMTLLASLFDETSWFFWGLAWLISGKTKESLIVAAKKMSESLSKDTDWSIWRAESWEFTFYTLKEMEDAVMKKWEKMEWMEDAAWGNYLKYRVKETDGQKNYTAIEKEFTWESLTALALYLEKLNYKSTIVDENDGFKNYIKTKLPNTNAENYKIDTPGKWKTIEDLKNINEENYPEFAKVLAKYPELKSFTEIQLTENKWINVVDVVDQLFAGKDIKNFPPWIIENIWTALKSDFSKIKKDTENSITSNSEKLSENKLEDILASLGIDNKIHIKDTKTGATRIVTIIGPKDCSTLTDESRKHALDILNEKKVELLKEPEKNKEKIEKIDVLVTILNASQIKDAATTTGTQLDVVNPKEVEYNIWTEKLKSFSKVSHAAADLRTQQSKQSLEVDTSLLAYHKLPNDWRQNKEVSIKRLRNIQSELEVGGLDKREEILHSEIDRAIELREDEARTAIKLKEYKDEDNGWGFAQSLENIQSGYDTPSGRFTLDDTYINTNLDYYRSSLIEIDSYNSQFTQATRITATTSTTWQFVADNLVSSRNTYTLADIGQSTSWSPSYYPASQISEFSSLWLSPETLSSTNISQTGAWEYTIQTTDDQWRKYELNNIKERELKNKMTDIDILASMNAQILIPYLKMIQVFTPYNPQIRDITAKDEKEKNRSQLISTIALLLWETIPGTTGWDREEDIKKLQQKYTTSSSIFQKLSSQSRWVDQVFDDWWSLIQWNFERILRWLTPPIEQMTHEQILAKYGPQYIKPREWISFDRDMEKLRDWTMSALNTLKSTITITESEKYKAQWQVLTWEYHA